MKTPDQFKEAVELTFKNAMRYNAYKEYVWLEAERLLGLFYVEMKKVKETMAKEAQKKHNDEICVVCTGKKFVYEPADYTCNGTSIYRRRRRKMKKKKKKMRIQYEIVTNDCNKNLSFF